MTTISTANFLTLADNIAKSCLDLEAAFIANIAANAPTATTITNGQTAGSNSLLSRVAALNDIIQERDLANGAYLAATGVTSYLNIANAAFYQLYVQLMNALEAHVGGVSAFITTNTLMVHPEFASAFNYYAGVAVQLALKGTPVTKVPTTAVFVPQAQTLASIAVTGSATGTFSAGTAVDLSKYAPLPLYLKNTGGSGTTGTATSFTVTYTKADGTSGNATQALSGSLAAGATLAIASATGSAVSNIVVNSGGANGDAIAVIVQPTRTVTY